MLNAQKDKLAQVKETAKSAAESANEAKQEGKKTSDGLKQLRNDFDAFKKKVESNGSSSSNAERQTQRNEPTKTGLGNRELQVVAKGLTTTLDEDEIIKQVRTVSEQLTTANKIMNIFTIDDPSTHGIIEFKTLASKIGFLN